jgi:hypothetical protein
MMLWWHQIIWETILFENPDHGLNYVGNKPSNNFRKTIF